MTNLAHHLADTAAADPDQPAVVLDEHTVTYADLARSAAQMATWLTEAGVGEGDRVALMLPNLPAFPVIYYGALRCGAVVVPMNPLFKRREIEHYLSDSGARLIFAMPGEEVQAAAEATGATVVPVGPKGLGALLAEVTEQGEIVAREDDDSAVILYTSGTTGRPKGAALTHRNLDSNQRTTVETLLHLDSQDVVMGCLPLFHVFGMTCGMNAAVATGATLTLVPRFDPATALQVIERDRVTVFEGVPTMYGAMLTAARRAESLPDLSSLRTAVSGGSSMPVEVLRTFEETFSCVILEGYGLSETSPVASFNHPDAERKAGSIGTPIRGVEMMLVSSDGTPTAEGEIGEIAIRGENIMAGYWNNSQATGEAIVDGWFRSGDLATRDEEGYYTIVDRKKDMIIRGGLNIYPREVEEVLYEHEAVAEAAVVGVPHRQYGEEVAAYVVLHEGATATEDELRQHVKAQVAAYKYPREVHLVAELPKGATGKILKRELGPS
ncbi:MAG TPA: long-chain fatty acid--CoA ligase [Ornithinimicrobium sp.]|uniref:long-chain-fatty-acid--CoA ligase n=1 Tax=Ornithinimicrobium sp. TaxID=1977084 RepID=UPI002B46FB95|nr:long-chain fatty acid--CoA ligase [Ornithinimicrobium sp.]HKJ11434.1 long-chain fatty acid--CoA ligase [Ornithinimicrobium sp.]